MKAKKPQKTRASISTLDSKDSLRNRKLPQDPSGDFKRGAARAKKVIALYEKLSPGLDVEFLVSNIVRDLICLSACVPELGNVDEESVFAMETYLDFAAENMWEAWWYDDLETARVAAERMVYPDLK